MQHGGDNAGTRARRTARRRPRAALAAGALLLAAGLWGAAHAGTLPFMDPFDDTATGVLQNRNDWQSWRQNDVQVESTVVYAGTKGAGVGTNALVWNQFDDPTATNVWIDFYARASTYPASGAAPVLTGSVAVAFYVDNTGVLHATSNNTWIALNYTVPTNVWRRYTVNVDYRASRWSLFMADDVPNRLSTAVMTNAPFSAMSTNTYLRTFRIKN